MARTLSDFDYRWVLQDPSAVGTEIVAQRPLPELHEPYDQPDVSNPAHEPLVAIEHRRIRTLNVYWHANWPAAVPNALLRQSAVERLYLAASALPEPFGLAVLDAWRPLALQHEIYDAACQDPMLEPGFVSLPSADPATPPPHATGGTVDVTLTFNGHALRLGTDFDDFTQMARTNALEGSPGQVRELRRLLFWTMSAAGFSVLDCEWWHFEFGTRRHAALCGTEALYGPAGHLEGTRP